MSIATTEPLLHRAMVVWHMLRSPRLAPGSAARERVLGKLDQSDREILEHVRPADWVDEWLTVRLTEALVDGLGLADDETVRKYFRDHQTVAYSRVYKMVLSFLKPRTLLDRAGWFWTRQHRSGQLVVDRFGDDWAKGRIVDHPPIAHRLYAIAVLAGIEATLALTGAAPVRGEIVATGPDWAEFEVRWG